MLVQRRRDAFDHPAWLFELKHDGFRAVVYIERGSCHLVSPNGNRFASFQPLADALGRVFPRTSALLGGEIVCVDAQGGTRFNAQRF